LRCRQALAQAQLQPLHGGGRLLAARHRLHAADLAALGVGMLSGKHMLLVTTRGIAADEALELIRLSQKAGGTVQAILTRAATEFVTPLSVSALSGSEALTELFDLTRESRIGHIELSRAADLIVIAPASADFLAKLAH